MNDKTLKAAFSTMFTVLVCDLHMVAAPLTVLLAVMVADYLTGIFAAWETAALSSRKGLHGIIKKIGYLFAIAAAMGVDWLIGAGMAQVGIHLDYTVFFGVLVTIWLIINELISILENLVKIGVPLPKFLMATVRKLKVAVEQKGGDCHD